MIDPVTKSGFLASTSMATIDDESNAEDVQRPCRSVFTDHTLAHPLNCRGGVVARLSA